MAIFKTIHTTYGLRRMAQAEATGTPINLVAMAVGDGNGNEVFPNPQQTQLVREIAASRRAPNRIYPDADDPTAFTAELVIPASVSGFTMREIGVYDSDGGLFVVGNLPATYKPDASEGSYADTVVRVHFMITNAGVVTIILDPNVAVATHTWISNNVTAATLLPGGTTGQILKKRSNADGDATWDDPGSVNVLVSSIEEEQTLADGLVNIDLTLTTTAGLAVYIDGVRIPKRAGSDGWLPHDTILTRAVLGKPYPANTKIICAQNEPNSKLVDPLARSLNLSDLLDKASARTNLDVFSRAEAAQFGPTGQVAYFARSTAPSGWMKANGGAVSRVAYAELFALIGTTYGAGDGFNTFNLPDLRGEFLRCFDDARGVDIGRVIGSPQAQQLLSHGHGATSESSGNHSHTGTTEPAGEHQHDSGWGESFGAPYGVARTNSLGSRDSDTDNNSFLTSRAGAHSHTVNTNPAGGHSHNINVSSTGGAENRPRNVALLACIKY